ncbi:three-Cys-motif partner protein TcmP [Pedobacter metabolipauper]|uniref:Three-Cys-motif partner protein n=1 Tax=Pedobacter metabolipauper TaxID=425513 RepID=A0A4R6STZ5_9SPHI|nr:three-Cys-motif partner protein TcmP [Pedobacter metabolipauper]TDQ08867.1 three-Cys-motif partner protein [Pedobacter metabolipauper]
MAGKNLFRKPFDEGTIVKLKLYTDYLNEWAPVFLSKKVPIWKTIQIFDFFAGQGKDSLDNPGSPLIALEVIRSFEKLIIERELTVILHFNELEEEKYNALVECLEGCEGNFKIRTYKQDFQSLFNECYESMKESANFLFLDQNGIKEITSELFARIIVLKQTDFLFFISSSYFRRFANTPEFQKHFPFDPIEMQNIEYYHIHRKVLAHYKSLIPVGKTYYLAPFSIRKERNIYGLIFGTNHTLGIEKFLNVAWKNDKLRGEANYDIDSEKIDIRSPSLFPQFNIPSKRDVFEKNLTAKILSGEICKRNDAYLFTLNEGFLLKDANTVLKKLWNDKKIKSVIEYISTDLHKHKQDIPIII